MARNDPHEQMRRFYREQGPSGKKRIVADITEQVVEQTQVDARGLYRFLLNDDTLLAPGEKAQVEEALGQVTHLFGLDDLREREEFKSTMAEVLREQTQRYVFEPKLGLFRDSLDGNRYISEAERTFEMLAALKGRVEAERAFGDASEQAPVPDHLPVDWTRLVRKPRQRHSAQT